MNRNELKKIDFHIHTPVSVCYSEKTVKPEDIVEAAIREELDAIAVTDHNSAAGIDMIREVAGERLYIIPGIEVTTKNGHFLALFEPEAEIIELEKFLEYAGLNKKGWGDAHTVAGDDTVVTLEKIHECGGLVVAAHIDRWPSGFMESKTTRRNKRKIHESKFLDALEITIPETRHNWNEGTVRDFPMKRACIQGSDAHKPEEVGRRPVYIKMEKIGLIELGIAFKKFNEHIYFPEDINDVE